MDGWIIENLNNALETWNTKLSEVWELLSATPQNFKGGGVWSVITSINDGLVAIGLALLVVFTAISIFGSAMNFRDFKRPEYALRHFIRFVAAKAAVTYCLELMTTIFEICGGVVSSISAQLQGVTSVTATLPAEVTGAIEDLGFLKSIPLWLISLLGSLVIIVLSFIIILTVYSRFFKIYMYTALAPVPLSTFAGESTSAHGKSFLKSYMGVCLEGAIILLACIIFSAFASGEPTLTGDTVFVQVLGYLAEVVFDMLVLVGLVKASDRIAKELFGV